MAGIAVEGRLRERGTRKPLAQVNIYCLPIVLLLQQFSTLKPFKAITNNEGYFVFNEVPEGKIHWVVNLTNYDRLDQEDTLPTDHGKQIGNDPVFVDLYLEKTSYGIYETRVYGHEDKPDPRTKHWI